MEKEILELLKQMKNEINERFDKLESKVDGIVEQTADLVEFRSDILDKVDGIREDLATVELVTAKNYKDIVNLKAVK